MRELKITRTNYENMRDNFRDWLSEVYKSHIDCLNYTFDVLLDDENNIINWNNGALMDNEWYKNWYTIYSLKGWNIEEQLHNDFNSDCYREIIDTLEHKYGEDVEERDDYDDLYENLYNELLEKYRDDYYDYYIFECDLPQFDDLDIEIVED